MPRVEDVIGLNFAQREPRHQRALRLVLLADDADHLVEIRGRRRALMPATSSSRRSIAACRCRERLLQHVAPVVEPLLQSFDEPDHARRDAVDQYVHADGDARLELAELEELAPSSQPALRCAPAARGRCGRPRSDLVADVAQQRRLLLVEQFGELLDQPPLLHAVRNFRDDRDPAAAPVSSLTQRERSRNAPRPVR